MRVWPVRVAGAGEQGCRGAGVGAGYRLPGNMGGGGKATETWKGLQPQAQPPK